MNEFEKSIGHRKHYMRSELENLVKSSGFSIIEIRCAGFPFFNLYKIIAFLRGKKIMQNDINPNRKISKILRIIFKIFNVLFHFNLTNSPFGWQLILIAIPPFLLQTEQFRQNRQNLPWQNFHP